MAEKKRALTLLKLLLMFRELATPKAVLVVFGLVLVLVTTAIGGMKPDPEHQTQHREGPTTLSAAPFSLTTGAAYLTTQVPGYTHQSKTSRFIVVPINVTVEAEQTVTSNVLTEAIVLKDTSVKDPGSETVKSDVKATLLRVDGGRHGYLQPAVPTKLLAYWEQPLEQTPPEHVTLTISRHIHRTDFFSGRLKWADPSIAVELSQPLGEQP